MNFSQNKKVSALIQARLDSTRLSEKVIADICGKPLIEHLINILKSVPQIDLIVLATTTNPKDEILVKIAENLNIYHFRGEEEDPLGRFYFALQKYPADVVVRICGDNCLIDPEILSKQIIFHIEEDADYTYISPEKFPLGAAGEVMKREVLEESHKYGNKRYHREHVTQYIWDHPEKFKLKEFLPPEHLQRKDIRLTVDTPEDLEFVRKIYERLYKEGQIIRLSEVIKLLDENPELKKINAHIKQKEVIKD